MSVINPTSQNFIIGFVAIVVTVLGLFFGILWFLFSFDQVPHAADAADSNTSPVHTKQASINLVSEDKLLTSKKSPSSKKAKKEQQQLLPQPAVIFSGESLTFNQQLAKNTEGSDRTAVKNNITVTVEGGANKSSGVEGGANTMKDEPFSDDAGTIYPTPPIVPNPLKVVQQASSISNSSTSSSGNTWSVDHATSSAFSTAVGAQDDDGWQVVAKKSRGSTNSSSTNLASSATSTAVSVGSSSTTLTKKQRENKKKKEKEKALKAEQNLEQEQALKIYRRQQEAESLKNLLGVKKSGF